MWRGEGEREGTLPSGSDDAVVVFFPLENTPTCIKLLIVYGRITHKQEAKDER